MTSHTTCSHAAADIAVSVRDLRVTLGGQAILRGVNLTVEAGQVINCTGPLGVIQHSAEPVIRNLLAQGYGRPDPIGLGLEVDQGGQLIGGEGAPTLDLYAIGPLTRGAFWEMTAVPDLRGQARDLAAVVADRLTNADGSVRSAWP